MNPFTEEGLRTLLANLLAVNKELKRDLDSNQS
jgi:hypothetical protein